MLQLPEDVIFLIVEQLDQLHRQERSQFFPPRYQPGLSQYAVVNRTWNAIIERETFRHIFVCSDGFTRKDFDYSPTPSRFKEMMNRDPARRRAIIQQISFYASHKFPLDSDEAQSKAGGAANDRHFSQSVREFWKVLQGLEWPKGRTFTLRFSSLSVVKQFYDGRMYPSGPYLHLIGDTLPYLSCVSSFLLGEYLRICPSSLLRIVATMKELRHVQLRLDDTIINPEQRLQYRKDLGTCISQLPTSSLLSFEAVFCNMPLGLGEQPAVTPGSPDVLCIAIRNLSMYLRDLRLEDLRVSPELFWPTVEQQRQQPASGPTPQPLWPHLETLYLNFEPVDSYGRFYADPIPEELAYNATQNTPVESIKRALPRRQCGLHQLIAAAGRAIFQGGMLRLQMMLLEIEARGLQVMLNFDGDERGNGGNFRLEWLSQPPVVWTDEVLEAWGLDWRMCEVGEEGWVIEEGTVVKQAAWSLVANLVPWR